MGNEASRPIALVFLGCGRATQMHSRTLSKLDSGVRLHYASRDRDKAEGYRRTHGGVGAYGSYDAAIDDPNLDVVFVATPPPSHLPLTIRALERGKDVIVEKPAFLQRADFAAARQAADRAGKSVFVAENYFYKPLTRRLKQILADGLIGDPLFVQVNALKQQKATGWRADPLLTGGGGLFEGGIHWINFMASLGLEVEGVTGHRAPGPIGDPGTTTNENVLVALRYAGGALGSLSYSWDVPSRLGGLRMSKIYGRAGSLTFESNGLFVLLQGKRTRFYVPSLRDLAGYRAMFKDFLNAVRTGAPPGMTLDMAARDVDLVREIYSASGGPAAEAS
ncbi:MAG: Gfo/Idh/MocA family protein [Longimicrobiales bacterium]